ncbi:MAG TPA: hypothetical protein PKE62_07390 [Anaerolineales bacterium]|nr:hypothetical protein [Anaerolineales bacterium]
MNILNHQQSATERRRKNVVRIGIGTVSIVVLSIMALFPPYQSITPSGPYKIVTARHTYIDPNRIEEFNDSGENRKVNAVFWFPDNAKDGKNFPLVVFSHGGLGTEDSNESLYLELASHGYVVASIGHPYHAFWTEDEGGRITFVNINYFQELQQENAQHDKPGSYRYYQQWMETRMGDINFVIDTILDEASNDSDGVYNLVDVTKIGVMGHSLGGSAALGIPRQRDDVDVVIALESPFLYDITGVEYDEFVWIDEPYPVPVLNIYSDSSWGHLSDWTQYARNYEFLIDAPENVFSLHLPGRGHFSMTDLSLASPLLTRLFEGGQTSRDREGYLREINLACLEFFDRYLKNIDRVQEMKR